MSFLSKSFHIVFNLVTLHRLGKTYAFTELEIVNVNYSPIRYVISSFPKFCKYGVGALV